MSSGGSSSSSPSISPVGNSSASELHGCQRKLDDLKEKEAVEIVGVDSKYNKLRKPLYDKRAVAIEKIPNFWVNAIRNHPLNEISKLVDKENEDCLHLLKKLEVEEFENVVEGFRIRFVFADENPFFNNSELVKEFPLGLDFYGEKSTSTTIEWKDLELSKKLGETIDARRKRGVETHKFFSWFSYNRNVAHDSIAEIIKEDLWPDAIRHYLTPKLDDVDNEGFGEDPEDSEDEDEDEDYDYDESLDDDDGEGNGEGKEEGVNENPDENQGDEGGVK